MARTTTAAMDGPPPANPGRAAPPTGLGASVLAQGRLVLRGWPRRVIVLVTVAAGVASATAVVADPSLGDPTIASLSGPVQNAMSVTLPFLGVLLVQGRPRPTRPRTLAPSVLAALAVAVLLAGVGVALGCLLTATSQAAGRWEHTGTIIVGSVLVQAVAQLTGTGWGLLVRRPVVACLLTIAPPLGLWLLLGTWDALQPAQAWLTPFASARNLLAGEMSPLRWAQWLVMASVWGLGLNLLGYRRATRTEATR